VHHKGTGHPGRKNDGKKRKLGPRGEATFLEVESIGLSMGEGTPKGGRAVEENGFSHRRIHTERT